MKRPGLIKCVAIGAFDNPVEIFNSRRESMGYVIERCDVNVFVYNTGLFHVEGQNTEFHTRYTLGIGPV